MNDNPSLAVIGGSGLYEMPGLADVEQRDIKTPFGAPSSPIVIGTLEGRRVAFLSRHGPGHTLNPSEVNYRANIYAIKSLGVQQVVSVSACGSLREDYAPGSIVVPRQLVDFTKNRKRSFFEDGFVAHVSPADPFCPHLSEQGVNALERVGATVHAGGAFITVEGPRFSTRGESNLFRSWGMSIIGMTTSPEAFLACEAELCYAVMAHVTDYDVWHKEPVTAEMVMKTVGQNLEVARAAIRALAVDLDTAEKCSCASALAPAITTAKAAISPAARKHLGILVEKYLDA
jgi:5'-methylthioadenosine phosphorylase